MEYVYDDEYSEETIATKRALQAVSKEYKRAVVELIRPYPPFEGENVVIFSTKIWADLKKEFRKPDDILLDNFEKAVRKFDKTLLKMSIKDGFKAYRTLIKITRTLINGEDFDSVVEEGEYV